MLVLQIENNGRANVLQTQDVAACRTRYRKKNSEKKGAGMARRGGRTGRQRDYTEEGAGICVNKIFLMKSVNQSCTES